MNVALKEWASLVQAIEQGRQIALLRKGGIVEAERSGFTLRHREFLFYPTYEHQHAAMIRPEWQGLVQAPEPGVIRVNLLARVEEAFPAPADRGALLAAGEAFVWNEAFVNQRYDYRPDLPLWLIAVRAYRIPEVVIPERGSYAGCKSWVNLTEEIAIDGAVPVLPDAEYDFRKGLLPR